MSSRDRDRARRRQERHRSHLMRVGFTPLGQSTEDAVKCPDCDSRVEVVEVAPLTDHRPSQ
jgi:hypothetical protein